MEKEKNYWFPAKRPDLGWGWGPPITWQGWVVFITFVILLTVGSTLLAWHNVIAGLAFIAIAPIVLILICWWKGEPPGGGTRKM
ncbi:MAG: hypothetical protein ACXW2U_18590 [Telluria sp.]